MSQTKKILSSMLIISAGLVVASILSYLIIILVKFLLKQKKIGADELWRSTNQMMIKEHQLLL